MKSLLLTVPERKGAHCTPGAIQGGTSIGQEARGEGSKSLYCAFHGAEQVRQGKQASAVPV